MAFTAVEIQPQRWTHFTYFTSGGADGVVTESLNPGVIFQLTEIRMHLSVAFASVEDFTVRMSAIQGSAHNLMIVSQAMNTIQDYLFQPESTMIMLSDDQLVFTLSLASGVNVVGIDVLGWAVRG